MAKENYKKRVDEPVMSDLTILVSIEDLISMAMGPPGKNVVNFKMIQTILHILARQMRLLSTHVDLRITEKYDIKEKKSPPSGDVSTSTESSPRDLKGKRDEKPGKTRKKDDKAAAKDKVKTDKVSAKENEEIEKEQEKIKNMTPIEKKKYLKEKEKQVKVEKETDKAKEEKEFEKMTPEKKEKYLKEKEQKELENMTPTERADYVTEKEKEDYEKMTPDQKAKYFKEKEQSRIERMTPEERAEYMQEKEMLAKMTPKEKEKYLKKKAAAHKHSKREKEQLEKMSPKEREEYLKKKEELELGQMSSAEKEKYLKEKEQRDLEKMSPDEREKYLKEKATLGKKSQEKGAKRGRSATGTSIAITEGERPKGEKILIAEKGAVKRTGSRTRIGSIEVVTHSQFELLEGMVKKLTEKAGPLPMPTLPDNATLRSELMRGSASLTDTMQAMQVAARVQAAEQTIDRLVGLLTNLAASGSFPEEFTEQLENVWAGLEAMHGGTAESKPRPTAVFRKSVVIDPQSHKSSRIEGIRPARPSSATGRTSISGVSTVSRGSSVIGPAHVTHSDMDDAIQALKDEMLKNVGALTQKANFSAENAALTAKSVAEKLDIALNLDSRITALHGLTADYTEQLSGFDVGITTQMQSFQEQISQMRGDLKSGLHQLGLANNNAETAAVIELTERYEGLETELDSTVTEHQNLTTTQKQLGHELQSLVEAVEMLREQKADTDEVLDGLRDKADLSRLAGLLTEQEFAMSRMELESRLDVCYDKFQRQENVWMGAIEDLKDVAMQKAEIMHLLGLKEDAQKELNDIQEKLRILSIQLGEPKAAILTRLISKDGACASCKEAALIVPTERTYGEPAALPALRQHPPTPAHAPPEPCVPGPAPVPLAGETDHLKSHVCQRWVGGSHTLMTESVTREKADGALVARGPPVNKYTGYGSDGKLYMMEDEMMPCEECNVLPMPKISEEEKLKSEPEAPPVQEEGAGDTVKITTVVPPCICTKGYIE